MSTHHIIHLIYTLNLHVICQLYLNIAGKKFFKKKPKINFKDLCRGKRGYKELEENPRETMGEGSRRIGVVAAKETKYFIEGDFKGIKCCKEALGNEE